jgi:hypothetical protein
LPGGLALLVAFATVGLDLLALRAAKAAIDHGDDEPGRTRRLPVCGRAGPPTPRRRSSRCGRARRRRRSP